MRGEDVRLVHDARFSRGSPPHARGRPECDHRPLGVVRITPACAGKTRGDRSRTTRRPDHPRMRGEDSARACLSASSRGSPPHARGRRMRCTPAAVSCRITPACAGKTRGCSPNAGALQDHPRMRGEDVPATGRKTVAIGSPPHARGRQHPHWEDTALIRITPACAGKTTP